MFKRRLVRYHLHANKIRHMYVHNIRQLSNPGQVQTAEKEMRV